MQARVVSTSGGMLLSRKGVRSAATQRELEDAYASGWRWKAGSSGRSRAATRCASPASAPSARCRRSTSSAPTIRPCTRARSTPSASSSSRTAARTWSCRGGRSSNPSSARRPTRCGRRSWPARSCPAGWPRCSSSAPSWTWAAASRGCCTSRRWPGRASPPPAHRRARRRDHRQGAARRRGHRKISLGLKQLQNDPWATVAAAYEVGQVRTGRVTRVAEFGAFVELEPGIEALAHVSTFPPTGRAGGWAKAVPVGHDRRLRDPDHRPGAEAHRGRDGRSGHRPRRRRGRGTRARSSPGRSSPARSSGTRSSASSSSSRRARPA